MQFDLKYKEIDHLDIYKGYKLCYIRKAKGENFDEDTLEWDKFNDGKYHLNMFFTDCPIEEQYGDDWDDAPYEYNSGEPYDSNYINGEYIEHHIIKVDVPFKYDNGDGVPYYYQLPEDFAYNSPFSVETINQRVIAWLYATEDSYNPHPYYAVIHGGDDIVEIFNKLKPFIADEEDNT